MELVDLVQTMGFPIALVVFFVWQQAKREERINARMDKFDSYITNELSALVKQNTIVMSRLEKWLERHDDPPTPKVT